MGAGERPIVELRPASTRAPAQLTDVRRAGELLGEVRTLWAHPGVTQEQRGQLAIEVFERLQLDEHGIRSMEPREAYRPLVPA